MLQIQFFICCHHRTSFAKKNTFAQIQDRHKYYANSSKKKLFTLWFFRSKRKKSHTHIQSCVHIRVQVVEVGFVGIKAIQWLLPWFIVTLITVKQCQKTTKNLPMCFSMRRTVILEYIIWINMYYLEITPQSMQSYLAEHSFQRPINGKI